MSQFREYPDAFDERWTVRRASTPERAAEMDEMEMGADETRVNKQTNNGRSPNPSPPALLPLSRLVRNFCPMRWRHGWTTSRTVCSAHQIT